MASENSANACAVRCLTHSELQMESPTQHEYKVIRVSEKVGLFFNAKSLEENAEETANALAAEGWRLVSTAHEVGPALVMVFERVRR